MSKIPFTDRELKRAWRELSLAATPTNNLRTNPQRLLLFYAVECGLKTAWLKKYRKSLFDGAAINKIGHDLHQLSKELGLRAELSLPDEIKLPSVKPTTGDAQKSPRTGPITILHQVWRYGGKCETPSDEQCEQKLQKIQDWIQGDLK